MTKEEMEKELESLKVSIPCQQCYEQLSKEEFNGKKRCMMFFSVGCSRGKQCDYSHANEAKLTDNQQQHVINQLARFRRMNYLKKCLSGDGPPGGKGKRSGSKGAGKGKRPQRPDGKLGVCHAFQQDRCGKSADKCRFAHVLYANDPHSQVH